MKKRAFIYLTFTFSFLFCFSAYSQSQYNPSESDKVLSTALYYFNDSINSSAQNQIVVIDSTQTNFLTSYESLDPKEIKLIADTNKLLNIIFKFSRSPQSKLSIRQIPNIGDRIVFVTNREKNGFFNSSHHTSHDTSHNWTEYANNWTKYNKNYPKAHGFYKLTQPYIETNYAMVSIENYCGALCGKGYIFILQFEADSKTWKIIYKRKSWG